MKLETAPELRKYGKAIRSIFQPSFLFKARLVFVPAPFGPYSVTGGMKEEGCCSTVEGKKCKGEDRKDRQAFSILFFFLLRANLLPKLAGSAKGRR